MFHFIYYVRRFSDNYIKIMFKYAVEQPKVYRGRDIPQYYYFYKTEINIGLYPQSLRVFLIFFWVLLETFHQIRLTQDMKNESFTFKTSIK